MVKEILDYSSSKTSDGTLVVSIRFSKTMMDEVSEKISKLKAILN
jgi:hypothetical protein